MAFLRGTSLTGCPTLNSSAEGASGSPSPFGFLIRSPDRDRIVAALEAKRIQTRPLFAGNLLRHPCMTRRASGGTPASDWAPAEPEPDLPMTDAIMRDAFWIGVYPGVTDEMRAFVVSVIREACGA